MNWSVTVAGLVCAFTTIGHFVIGSKQFLKPMLEATFDPVPKKVMHCVFHYISAFLILSTAALLCIGLGVLEGERASILAQFISVNYAVFALWQIALAASSQIPQGIIKLFTVDLLCHHRSVFMDRSLTIRNIIQGRPL